MMNRKWLFAGLFFCCSASFATPIVTMDIVHNCSATLGIPYEVDWCSTFECPSVTFHTGVVAPQTTDQINITDYFKGDFDYRHIKLKTFWGGIDLPLLAESDIGSNSVINYIVTISGASALDCKPVTAIKKRDGHVE